MTKDKAESPKKGGKMKKLLLLTLGSTMLIGAGAGAGIYMGGGFAAEASKPEDLYPKLVLRSKSGEAAPASEAGKEEAPLKVGTVSVPNDRFKVDPRKYEITYIPVDQAFTTNLADGSGFLQVGISLATFYDGKLVSNVRRQMVPIRSAVLMVLAEQDPALLSTSHGKQQLQRRLTGAINAVLREKEGFGGVDNVYFTSLVIQ
ncbi:flagellar basal body-associated FliL family protein [Sphingopyxis sp. 113P3]|uniref:flagellar basal body-associated FliL family protein n=1 Tax=Sphingopyxis sp. (strain 113P3) TaxID=292913 RepID=UPI0006AD567A|nr:flagellar basal body-associated FliL family protein [Sphingopyxis sp. 113P3]ALC14027.1 flagellar basal body-associated protein FliL [Sphingopyxis sp. 113P3]